MGLPSSRRRFKLGKRVNASGVRFVSLLLKRKLNGAEEVFSFFCFLEKKDKKEIKKKDQKIENIRFMLKKKMQLNFKFKTKSLIVKRS